MTTMTRAGIALLVAALLCAAAPVAAEDASDLAGRVATWQSEYNADNLDAMVAMYTADACRMPPNMEAVRGPEAIREHFQAGKEAGWAQVELAVTEASTSGEMGWGSGTYVIMDAQGNEIDHGKWMNVSKMSDGEWKIHCDIWNSNVALEPTD